MRLIEHKTALYGIQIFLRTNIDTDHIFCYKVKLAYAPTLLMYFAMYCIIKKSLAKDCCTAKLILYTQGVEMGQDIIVLGT